MRVRLGCAYDGTGFSGWAAQPGRRTVEGALGEALQRVTRVDQIRLTVAGRTDAGVHATGQVAHVDLSPERWAALPGRSDRPPEEALLTRLAGVLEPDVVVASARVVPDAFDARFAALWRRYEYRIADPAAVRDPLRRADTVWWSAPLDERAMTEAAAALTGLNDFAAFCKRRDGATTIRTLLDFGWRRSPDGVLVATIRADAFCHSMVRSLVGALVEVGQGRRAVSWPTEVLAGASRSAAFRVMPAHGLTLVEVAYPPDDRLAQRVAQARATRE